MLSAAQDYQSAAEIATDSGLARRFHLGASADIAIFPGERAHVPDI